MTNPNSCGGAAASVALDKLALAALRQADASASITLTGSR